METSIDKSKLQVAKYWENKNILITGGTAGLGKNLAQILDYYGSHVAVIGRDNKKIGELKQNNSNIVTIQADISNKEDIYKITGQVVGLLGKIDVVINNASTLGNVPLQSLLDTPCENFSQALETNLLGPFRLIKAILPSMIFNNTKVIINITSDASVNAYENWGIYSITKAALDHMTQIWAKEFPKITFLAIDPGDMYTQMQLDANPKAERSLLYNTTLVAHDLASFIALSNNSFSKIRYGSSEWRELLH